MAPKEDPEFTAHFLPYLPPGTSRRERELQNAQVRSVAATRTSRSARARAASRTERRSKASTTQASEVSAMTQETSWPAYSVQQLLRALEADSTIPFPHATTNDRLFIDHYIQVLLSEAAPVYDLFGVSNIRDVFFLRLLQDPDFYYIGMALCLVKVGDFVSSDRSAHMRRGYELIGRGLSALRGRIEKSHEGADDITIMGTAYLAELASLTNDLRAHSIHRNSLRGMITSRDGLEKLGFEGAVKCSLLQMRSDWVNRASSSIEDVAFLGEFNDDISPTQRTSRSFASTFELQDITRALPEGFQALAIQRQLSPRTIKIVHRAAEIRGPTPSIASDHIEQKLALEMQPRTFMNFAEALPAVGRDPSEQDETSQTASLNSITIIAVFLFVCSQLNMHQTPVSSLLQDQFEAFRHSLSTELLRLDIPSFIFSCGPANESERGQVEACLTWIFLITIHSWMTKAGELSSEGVELVAQSKELTAGLDSQKDVQSLLQTFLCSESLRSLVETYWNLLKT